LGRQRGRLQPLRRLGQRAAHVGAHAVAEDHARARRRSRLGPRLRRRRQRQVRHPAHRPAGRRCHRGRALAVARGDPRQPAKLRPPVRRVALPPRVDQRHRHARRGIDRRQQPRAMRRAVMQRPLAIDHDDLRPAHRGQGRAVTRPVRPRRHPPQHRQSRPFEPKDKQPH
ncbi:MAG: hypothetical protein ACK56I_34030, partial [bacterium]